MTITAHLELFDTALAVTSDDHDELMLAWDNPPAWCNGYEFQSERELWFWLCVRDVPDAATVAAWCENVNAMLTAQNQGA